MTNFQMVREFHDAFSPDQNAEKPAIVDAFTWKLRHSLIFEEFKELIAAHHQGDLIAVADALGDLLYVVYGTGLAYGLDLDAAFAEIHRSNMTKLGPDGKPLRNEDGKVVKGPNWEPPNLEKVLGI